MNKIEKLVYDLVKKNPKIKNNIRNIYQSFYDILPRKKNFSINPIDTKEGFFFGFHDVSPFSFDDKFLLANKLTIPFRMPRIGDFLDVGYFPIDSKNTEFQKIGSSFAWNYHKGCRLQWLGAKEIIYNDVLDNKLISRTYNFKSKQKRHIPHAIDSVSSCGKFATSFSYERLEKFMPGYGYLYPDNSYLKEKAPAKTGLFIIDIHSGEKKMIINLDQLAKLKGKDSSIKESYHYTTHSLFSPDSRYVSFLHRWTKPNDVQKRWTRLIVYDRVLKAFHVSPTNNMVSHYVWNNKNQIIAYARIGNIDGHILFKTPELSDFQIVTYPQLNSDGHQSFIKSNSFITDTYPDKYRMARLYKVSITDNKATLIACLNSPKNYQSMEGAHWACDLHPRMNHSGNMVCFDSVHTGTRSLCLMKI